MIRLSYVKKRKFFDKKEPTYQKTLNFVIKK